MIKAHVTRIVSRILAPTATLCAVTLLLSGCGGAHFNAVPAPTVSIAASPSSITAGSSSTLTVMAANATQVTGTDTDGSTYALQAGGGTQSVIPKTTTSYTGPTSGFEGKTASNLTPQAMSR